MTHRVLVVDDDPDYRLLVRQALRPDERFVLVGEARGANDAVALAGDLQPDLVLLDIVMPGTDGFATLPALLGACPSCTTILMSAHPEANVGRLPTGSGAVGYLSKDVRPTRLPQELLALGRVLGVVGTALDAASAALAADPRSAAAARRFVTKVLEGWDHRELLDSVTLLVSEVVTNAVVHAGTELEVSVKLLAEAVRIEVTDRSETLPEPRQAADGDTSGRGMALVEILADAWGVEPLPVGKTVWFEMPRPDVGLTTAS